jgi:hypothetical protein
MGADKPSIGVYKHGTKDAYLFLRHAPLGNGASTTYGNFVQVSPDDMKTNGLDLIFADFQEFPKRDPKNGSVIHGFTPEAKKASKFLRNYDEVRVSLESVTMLSFGPVCPTNRAGDSGVVRKQDIVLIALPCTNEVFFQKLLRAFEKCVTCEL